MKRGTEGEELGQDGDNEKIWDKNRKGRRRRIKDSRVTSH